MQHLTQAARLVLTTAFWYSAHIRGWPSPIPCRPGTTAPRRRRILDFVARVTTEGGADFVPPAERIATFDNDGTLWCEQPMQVQVFFATRSR